MKSIFFIAVFVFACFFQSVFSDEDGKIYGGSYADEGQYPFMVHLYNIRDKYFFCGGSLIGPYHILTAAHCTDGESASNIAVFDSTVYANSGSYVYANKIFQNPNYNSDTIKNDLSVIKLSKPFAKTSGMSTIQLAKTRVSSGTTVTVAGWGGTEYYYYSYYLLYTNAPVISTSKCQSYSGYGGVSGSSQICAMKDGHDSCQGDSGGPLFTGSGKSATQHGIVSWGIGCGIKPGVYTAVNYFYDWIVSKTVHTVKTSCDGCATNTVWKQMCKSIGGTYALTSTGMECRNLNIVKTRQISYSWDSCTYDRVRDLCEKIGVYSCVNGKGKCSRL